MKAILKCGVCSKEFERQKRLGAFPKFCSNTCKFEARRIHVQIPCSTPDCKNTRYYTSGLCNSCYYRKHRTGTIDKRTKLYRTIGTNGYVSVVLRDHPLARKNGYVFEHRRILFDAIGKGPHPCHWCGDLVDWIKGKCLKAGLVPDHLDGDKQNNALSNLVPSSNPCNSRRGMFMRWVEKHKDDPVLWAMYEIARAKAG